MQMRKTYLFIGLIIMIILILWFNSNPLTESTLDSEPLADATVSKAVNKKDEKAQAIENNREAVDAYIKERTEKIEHFQKMETSTLDFYGQLIDQNGEPIPRASVMIGYAYYPTIPKIDFGWETKDYVVQTDQNGRFVLSDLEIVHLAIDEIKKPGYDFKGRGQKTFMLNQMTYEQISALSSQENPYTITGWKRGASEPLISTNKRIVIEGDGRLYTIDYENGWIKEGKHEGDIYISLYREFNPVTEKDYPWSFTLEANQGGIQQTDEHRRDVYVAPEAGYIQDWAIKYPTDNERWKDVLDVTFFVTSRNGKNHAVISLGIRAAYSAKGKNVVIFLQTKTNPNHSRNLQYSKNKTKKVGIRKKH